MHTVDVMVKSLFKRKFRGSRGLSSLRTSFKRSRKSTGRYDSGNYKRYGRQSTRVAAMYNPVPPRLHNIVAPRFFTDLEYGFSGISTVAASAFNFLVIGNSLQLPGSGTGADFTASGTLVPATHALNALQPVGYSALSGLYKKYRVWYSTCTVSLIPSNQTGSSFAKMLVLYPTILDGGVTDVQLAQSLPYAKAICVQQQADPKSSTLISKMDTKTIYGLSQAQEMADPNFQSSTGSSPGNYWYWNAVIQDLGNVNVSAAASNQVTVLVRISYNVEFYDPAGNEADT